MAANTAETAANLDETVKGILQLETMRVELLSKIDDLRQKRAAARLELLAKNKEQVDWLLESMSDLRKERMIFQKKALPDISAALKDGSVPDDLAKAWLGEISTLYHQDLSLAQSMLIIDSKPDDHEHSLIALRKEIDDRLKGLVEQMVQRAATPPTPVQPETGDASK